MSVTTPSTGQKISDFSVGTVDANSFLIQARNGSTEKVSATQIAQYSNLRLLFEGEGGLNTTNKTIVGAINEINAKETSDIADVQAAINAINSTAAPLFYLGTYRYTAASVAAGVNIQISKADFSMTDIPGYTPLAIGRAGVSKAGFDLTSFNVTGVSTVLSIRNDTSATITDTTVTITIIYVKSDFLQYLT